MNVAPVNKNRQSFGMKIGTNSQGKLASDFAKDLLPKKIFDGFTELKNDTSTNDITLEIEGIRGNFDGIKAVLKAGEMEIYECFSGRFTSLAGNYKKALKFARTNIDEIRSTAKNYAEAKASLQ